MRALVLTGLAIFALGLSLPYYRPIDDSYISYRYSKNLARGHGLVWNVGEPPVEGFTNFLLVVTEVPAIALGLDPLRFAQTLSIVAALATAFLLWSWCGGGEVGAFAALLWLAFPFLPVHVIGGLETVTFAFHLLLPVFLARRWLELEVAERLLPRGRQLLFFSALASVLAGLCRPEGFIVSASVLGTALAIDLVEARALPDRTRRLLTELASLSLAFVLPALGYHAWRHWYFGDFFPNSYYIKVAATRPGTLPGMPQLREFVTHPAVLFLLALAPLRGRLRRSELLLLPPLVFAAWFYVRSLHIMAFNHRFYLPYVPLLVLLAAPAFARAWSGPALARGIKCSVLAALFLFCMGNTNPASASLAARLQGKRPKAHPEETHFMLGRRMAALPNVRELLIVGPDAGAMPYFSEAKWIDPIGLNDNFIARHVHAPKAELIDYLFARKPDIMILCATGKRFVRGFPGPLGDETQRIASDPRFGRYRRVARFMKNSGGRYAYVYYVRKDLPSFTAVQRVLAD